MKIAVFTLFSLLCVQFALGASLRPGGETGLVEQSNKFSDVSLFTNEDNELERGSTRLNPLACVPAIKDIGSLGWKGYQLFRKRNQIFQKAKEGRENCNKTGGTPEEVMKCLKLVDAEQKASNDALTAEIWQLIPQIFTTFLALFKCLT